MPPKADGKQLISNQGVKTNPEAKPVTKQVRSSSVSSSSSTNGSGSNKSAQSNKIRVAKTTPTAWRTKYSREGSGGSAKVAPGPTSSKPTSKEQNNLKKADASTKTVVLTTYRNFKSGETVKCKIHRKPLSSSLTYDTSSPIPTLYTSIAKTTKIYFKLFVGSRKSTHRKPKKGGAKYEVLNETRKKIFSAQETSWWTGGSRPFVLNIRDLNENIVYTLQRHTNASLCFLGAKFYGSNALVKGGSTEEETLGVIGSIRQKFERGILAYEVTDRTGKTVMNINGPKRQYWCRNSVGSDASFRIIAFAEQEFLGELRVLSGPRPFGKDPYILGVAFPQALKPEYKVLILAFAALVHLSFFETKPGYSRSLYGNICFLLISLSLISATVFAFSIGWTHY